MSRENVEILRRVWEAAERGDTEAAFAFYDPAIVWETRYTGPVGSVYHGHEGVRQFFRDWLGSFETYRAQAETFIDAGDKVVVGYRISGRGKGSGVEIETARWNVYGIRNSLVIRLQIFETKAEALKAVGLSE